MRLITAYDAFLLDLDGVLYRGDQPIAAAAPAVAALRDARKRLVFLTNNSARTPEQVAEKLTDFGIPASPEEVVTSAQATADLLAREGDGDARTAYVIGQDGVREALSAAGFDILEGEPSRAAYVVVGWDGGVTYDALRRATILVRGGSRLVATNADASYPAPGGELWPGAGAILAAVETASGRSATIVGKPHRPLFEAALERAGTRSALMVGDRMETDVVGAVAAGLDACLVLTGVGRPRQLLEHEALPVALLSDVGGLVSDHPVARPRPATAADMDEVRALTAAPEAAAEWGPDDVWVIGENGLDATATVEVREEDAYLRAVATREELRRRGVGSIVAAAAVGSARRLGASRVWLLTEAAESFFSGLGFERVDRGSMPKWIEAGPGEGCPQTAVAMRRALTQ